MKRRRAMDFCAVHDHLLREALNAPRLYQKAYEFRVTFSARRLKHGVIIEGLKVRRET